MPQIEPDSYYKQLCEHLGVALIASNVDLNIRVWNDAAARMFGAAAEQMIGTPILSIVPQERRPAAERLLRRVIKTGETTSFEFQHRGPEGERRELIGTVAPVISESGARTGVSACLRDITRRKEIQTELNESRALAALGEMAGALAHHFNNILGGVVTSVDYATMVDDPALTKRVLDQTARALTRATRLVSGLLAFSEGDQHTDDLSDFTELLITLAEDIEQEIKDLDINLKVNLPPLPVLSVPRIQVTTILHNIVQNAIEAMPEGGDLGIDVWLEDHWVVTQISDSGCGLEESVRSRIFEPFWTTKGGLATRNGEGVGLGLAIAHGLVRVIGGAISVTSEPDKGSTFRVFIPRPKAK
jgi:PAS domain S-box-containing protein